jgi:hypothetical protein
MNNISIPSNTPVAALILAATLLSTILCSDPRGETSRLRSDSVVEDDFYSESSGSTGVCRSELTQHDDLTIMNVDISSAKNAPDTHLRNTGSPVDSASGTSSKPNIGWITVSP